MIDRKSVRKPLVHAAWFFTLGLAAHFVPHHGINRWVPVTSVIAFLSIAYALVSSFKLLFVVSDWIHLYRKYHLLARYRFIWICCAATALLMFGRSLF